MSNYLDNNTRISMQRAVLQPFPPLTTTPLSSLSEEQRLNALIQNLEAHQRNVKAALLATSLTTLSAAPTDPRLANRSAPQTHSDSQDALLASLKIPYKSGRVKSFASAAVTDRSEDKFFRELGEAMERSGEYERGNKEVLDGLRADRERLREKEKVEQEGKAGGYDRARDPRLKR
ncbi:hypothetical protein MMC11_002357 [Xylographa trunciseda]|nr:hypothetical protein [Xylographa trunciseda]